MFSIHRTLCYNVELKTLWSKHVARGQWNISTSMVFISMILVYSWNEDPQSRSIALSLAISLLNTMVHLIKKFIVFPISITWSIACLVLSSNTLTITLSRIGIRAGPSSRPITKAATAPPTCHVMLLIACDHHIILVSTRDCHMSQGGSTPATWVVKAPAYSIACMYLFGWDVGATCWTWTQDHSRP